MNDPILQELHSTRERLLEESGGTLAALVAKLERDQVQSGRELRVARRTKDCTEADGRLQSDGSPVRRLGESVRSAVSDRIPTVI